MASTKFKIEYTWNNKDRVKKVEEILLNEGWEKTNCTLPANERCVKPSDIFVTWFERFWII